MPIMTLDTFFKKFDQFADAPNAVAKMRELVLELAVQGKLVEPPSKPETDRAWLAFKKEISERIYSYDPAPPPPFEIPNHWEWCVLAEVADCRASAKVPPSSISDNDWVLDLEDIDGTTGQIIQFATFAERRSLSTKAAFGPGDVLYSKLRPYLNKVVVAEKKGFCTTEIIPLRPAIFHELGFLRIYLRSLTFLNYAAQKNYGMKMPRLGTKDLESAQIPLPPPSEQKRIVAKVDELMALCDRLEAQQQEREEQARALARASLARFAEAPTPANLNLLFHKSYNIPPADLRKAILTLAVQGKLVPSMGDTEIKQLGEILAEPSSNGISKSPTPDTSATEVLRISAGTSREDFFVNEADFKHVSLTATEIENAKLRAGDLLACRYNGNLHFVGRFSLYRGDSGRTQVNPDKLIRFRVDTARHDPRYVCFSMNSATTRAGIEAMCATTAGNIGLSAGRIKTIPITLPPLAEQRRIVAKVDQLMALVDQLETQLAASRATAKNLLEALVAELTSQGSSGSAKAAKAEINPKSFHRSRAMS